MMEVWKDIAGTNGSYEISNTGLVRSKERIIAWRNRERKIASCILAQQTTKGGYKRITIKRNNDKKSYMVHRLVAEAYVENNNPDVKDQVNHIDGNKSNNNDSNLEWVSCVENVHHAWDTGLVRRPTGCKNHKSTLSQDQVHDIRTAYRNGVSGPALAKRYNMSSRNIYYILHKETYPDD